VNRTVGTLLGHEITKRGRVPVCPTAPSRSISGARPAELRCVRAAGVTMRLEGDANDYLGKGLSGGRLIVHPDADGPVRRRGAVIAGNVIAYGATGGEIFLRGMVGERFCVRNSGATRRGRGRRRPRLRVHDRWSRGGARCHRTQLRRRHVGRHRLRVRPRRQLFASRVNYEMVSSRRSTTTTARSCRRRRAASRAHRLGGGTASAPRVGTSSVSRFRKVMPLDYKRVLTVMKEARPTGSTSRHGRQGDGGSTWVRRPDS
jgi:glutamate synthase (NADPH) large chain